MNECMNPHQELSFIDTTIPYYDIIHINFLWYLYADIRNKSQAEIKSRSDQSDQIAVAKGISLKGYIMYVVV